MIYFKPNGERQAKVGIRKPHFFCVRGPFTGHLKWVCWQNGKAFGLDYTLGSAHHHFIQRNK